MKVLLSILVTLVTISTYAADGSSGCGPGWYFFKDNSLVSSSLRGTTNGFLFPFVTFGMTFGTSNCTKHSIVETEKESLYYVTQNYQELKAESARGEGDFVAALGKVIGCKEKDLGYFSKKVQDNYERIFKANQSNENVLIETYKTILSDEVLVYSCSLS